jgi:hypothetical protein
MILVHRYSRENCKRRLILKFSVRSAAFPANYLLLNLFRLSAFFTALISEEVRVFFLDGIAQSTSQ